MGENRFIPVDPYEAVFFQPDHPRIEVAIVGENTILKERIQAILHPLRERYFGIIFGFRRVHLCCPWSASIMTKLLAHALPKHDVRVGFGFPPAEPARVLFHFWTEVDDTVFVDACHGPLVRLPRHKLYVGDVTTLQTQFARFDRSKPLDDQPQAPGYGPNPFENHKKICEQLRMRPSTVPSEWPQYAQYTPETEYTHRMIQELISHSPVYQD